MCNFKESIVRGYECAYCGAQTEYLDSSIVYGKSYGMIYICKPCEAWVGVHHKTSKIALGRVANRNLRKHKKLAHSYFDLLWKAKIKTGFTKNEARNKAYQWLSEQLSTPLKYTHIGMFDVEMCKKVIKICKPYIKIN